MTNISKRRDGCKNKPKAQSTGDKEFLKRIEKTLYYGKLPTLPCLSLPVTEISCELWSVSQRGGSLKRLHADDAAFIGNEACVSPCSLVLAIMYLERLKKCNPEYLAAAAPTELFLVSLMVGNKFLMDDGADIILSEWAESGGIDLNRLKKLEIDFLNAIDWKVFVSDDTFEEGLQWLEREVAMRQALLRGFFTYTDLTAIYNEKVLKDILAAMTSACLTVFSSYLSSLLTIMTSTLVITQTWLPILQYVVSSKSSMSVASPIIDLGNQEVPLLNTTLDIPASIVESDIDVKCTKWLNFEVEAKNMVAWQAVPKLLLTVAQPSHEPWWSTSAILDWLYHISNTSDPPFANNFDSFKILSCAG